MPSFRFRRFAFHVCNRTRLESDYLPLRVIPVDSATGLSDRGVKSGKKSGLKGKRVGQMSRQKLRSKFVSVANENNISRHVWRENKKGHWNINDGGRYVSPSYHKLTIFFLPITLFLGIDFQMTTGKDTKICFCPWPGLPLGGFLGPRLPPMGRRDPESFIFVLFRCSRSPCARAPSSLLSARTTRPYPPPPPPTRNQRAGSKHRRP